MGCVATSDFVLIRNKKKMVKRALTNILMNPKSKLYAIIKYSFNP